MTDLFSLGHLNLKEISQRGNDTIGSAGVAVVGLGGTGSLAAQLFVRAGFGHVTVIDHDVVNPTNLQRQINYFHGSSHKWKAEETAALLSQIRNDVKVSAVRESLGSDNLSRVLSGHDIIFDGTDNMLARKLINEFSVAEGIPWVFTSAIGMNGQFKAVIPGKTSCLTCMTGNSIVDEGSCSALGVLNSIPSIVSALAYTKALRIILGEEEKGEIHFINAWNMAMEKVMVNRNSECRTCSHHDYEYLT